MYDSGCSAVPPSDVGRFKNVKEICFEVVRFCKRYINGFEYHVFNLVCIFLKSVF